MSATFKITAKRQATLPRDLCEEMGVGPGDRLDAQRRLVDGEVVWILRPHRPDESVLGRLRAYARGRSDEMDDIRDSIARGLRSEERR
jgi:bifunctional DNA-binding transcriptional regulator/antitoxin component of YhaV-PrlF toxin-antitoxin module